MTCAPDDVRFVPAEPDDASGIVATILEGCAPHLRQLVLYGCSGAVRYVAAQISIQHAGGETHYTVARSQGRLLGLAEFRRLPQFLFLNNIAVRSEARGQRVATRLLREAILLAGQKHDRVVALDVFEDNALALGWYKRLGFSAQSTTTWYTSRLGPGEVSPVVISGYAQAEACQEAFGRDPKKVLRFHELRRRTVLDCHPHEGHRLIASLPKARVITQNIDGMHQRAGSRDVVELHA